MRMEKNKIFLASTLTALLLTLNGCGGESANVVAEVYDDSTASGVCKSGTMGCVEFALDYPLTGLNFTCSSDNKNRFSTIFDSNTGVATGACKYRDDIKFFIRGEKDSKIELGSFPISNVAAVSAAQLPRLTLLDIAAGIQGRAAQTLSPNDVTVKTAMRLIKLIQAAGLQVQQNGSVTKAQIANPRDIQPISIVDADRKKIEQITSMITSEQFKNLSDQEFAAVVKPWVDISIISDEDAFDVVQQLMLISNAAVYQPEFSLFSNTEVNDATSAGPEGLVGCDASDCNASNKTTTHLFGHFIIMTDRQGKTFGSGLQWRGKVNNDVTTISGVNAQLIRQVKPIQMTASAQASWIDPITKSINNNPMLSLQPNFKFNIANSSENPLMITQGKLFNDYMVAGTERFYKVLTGKTNITEEDKRNYGLWEQKIGNDSFKGTVDVYKIYPITYLDSRVFKSKKNINSGTYIFPLYADLTFTFTDTSVNTVKLGIVIDSNGDIRTNMKNKPAIGSSTAAGSIIDMSTSETGCSGNDVLGESMLDMNNVEQYQIGTVGRAFANSGTDSNKISLRMILSNNIFQSLNGALIGMNSSIQTSSSSNESIVIGGALLDLNRLLAIKTAMKPTTDDVPFKDSSGNTVKWANSFASFQAIYSAVDSNDEDAKQWSKYSGGNIDFKLAPCYEVKAK